MPDLVIACPACQSKVTADGRTLVERSAHLSDLEEAAALVSRLEKKLTALETKLAVPKLRDAPKEKKRRVVVGKKEKAGERQPEPEPGKSELAKPGRKPFW